MTNYSENIYNVLVDENEEFHEIKPEKLKKIIENPPKKYRDILDSLSETKIIEPDKYGRYRFPVEDYTQDQINYMNNKRKIIRANYIKFFLEFDVKYIPKNELSKKKAKKYGLISSFKECVNISNKIDSSDHVRQYITSDKKRIILSSPYSDDDWTQNEHLKYGFKKYNSCLYNDGAYTYYLILE